ncbi:MAG: hypothetical protein M1823_005471 [Watsoniomyces obsoletus]|nr:MAG: hypothetical protein M1823_005471 [Watsoniomyces obsoletus]
MTRTRRQAQESSNDNREESQDNTRETVGAATMQSARNEGVPHHQGGPSATATAQPEMQESTGRTTENIHPTIEEVSDRGPEENLSHSTTSSSPKTTVSTKLLQDLVARVQGLESQVKRGQIGSDRRSPRPESTLHSAENRFQPAVPFQPTAPTHQDDRPW